MPGGALFQFGWGKGWACPSLFVNKEVKPAFPG